MVAGAAMNVAIVGPVQTSPSSGSGTTIVGPAAFSSTTSNAAPVTSPGAAAALGSITTTAGAGTYEVTAVCNVGGTTGAVDISNISITANAVVTRIANGVGAPASATWQIVAGANFSVAAATVAAGTVGSVYGVTLIATRVV